MPDTALQETSKHTRSEVWGELYSAEYAFLYYQELEKKLLRTHKLFSWLTVALGGGAIAPAILLAFSSDSQADGYLGWWFAIQGIALAVVTLIDKMGNYGRKASIASGISRSCGRAARDLANLFSEIDQRNVDDKWARSRLDDLIRLKGEITNAGETAEIMVDNESKESLSAADSAYERLVNRYE